MKIPGIKILFFMLLIYYILNMIYPLSEENLGKRIYSQVIMALVGLYSLYYFFINIKYFYRNQNLKAFAILLTVFFVYSFIPSISNDTFFDRFVFFIGISVALSIMFCVYLCVRANEKDTKYIYALFVVQVCYAFWSLYNDLTRFRIEEHDALDSNSGFLFASCLPMCFTISNKRLRSYAYLLLFCGTILSGQRAAALGAFISLPFAFKYIKSNIKRFDYILFSIVLIILAKPVIEFSLNNLEKRHLEDMARGSDSYGAGRMIFWKIVWDDFWNGNIFQIMFGKFFQSIPVLLKKKYGMAIYSHNGWLDFLYQMGFLGFILYLRCYISLFKINKIVGKIMPEFKYFILMMLAVFLVRSSTSHGNFDIAYIPFCSCLAIILAKYDNIVNQRIYSH